jgi:DDE superfamily endonuclease
MALDSEHQRITKRSAQNTKHPLLCATIPGVVMQAILPFLFRPTIPQPMRTSSLSGKAYINEIVNCRNPQRIQEVLRMKLEVFQFLCLELKRHGGLAPSRYVGVEEQVAMFLHAVAHSCSNREVQERFQHSRETVSRHFHYVLQALNRLMPRYIKLPAHDEIPTAISNNSKFYPFFSDCIGALDGTHIAAKVPEEIAPAFRNRKGYLSQNVLACCDLDQLIFTYILAGWEGSAHDGLVLEAAFNKGFYVPKDKYYLGDAGYGLAPYCLTPYHGVRYHLREWGKNQQTYIRLFTFLLIVLALKMRRNSITYVILLYEMRLKGFLVL